MQRDDVAVGNSARPGPSVVGGSGGWAMPVHKPMVMPDLHGVMLEHHSSSPLTDEKPVR
ncbi:MAG: hypothetical protein ABI357_04955 [Granulicella sp.]